MYRVLHTTHTNNGVDLSVTELANYFFATNPRDREYYQTLFSNLDKADASSDSVSKLIQAAQTAKILREISLDAYDIAEGKGKLDDLMKKFEQLKTKDEEKDEEEFEFVSDDIVELHAKATKEPGLHWRLRALNRMFGPLRRGNFGFIFARPETGKTTFLASEVTFMAQQIVAGQGPILWLNNEQVGDEVMYRIYQAANGISLSDLEKDLEGYKRKYFELTNRNIKLYDNGHITKFTVERLCKQLRPSLIIFDQIDKIQGFDDDREDLRLGTIYQWAREIAKEYAPVIGVCQADGSGEGQKWLTMAHVANAKTAKQAEADWILGIGKQNEVGYDQIRYLHASKNKLKGDENTDPSLRHGRLEVLLDIDTARYKDI